VASPKKSGISSDLIDMLQGRIGKNIFFLKHYLTPAADYKHRVLDAVSKLKQEIDNDDAEQ
jgi:hypothetical protein